MKLVDDFKTEYKTLQEQLTDELGRRHMPDTYDEDEVDEYSGDLLDERIRELKSLKSFVNENK